MGTAGILGLERGDGVGCGTETNLAQLGRAKPNGVVAKNFVGLEDFE